VSGLGEKSEKDYQPVVDHVTRIVLRLTDNPLPYAIATKAQPISPEGVLAFGRQLLHRTERVAAMMNILAEAGFRFAAGDDCVYADSDVVEAQAAKRLLLSSGFKDQEFQVRLDYVRKWGML